MSGWPLTDSADYALADTQAERRDIRPFPGVDLAAVAAAGVKPPDRLCDWLYPGCLHSLAGPPESGKSTIAYWWALRLLAQGRRVALFDEEAGRDQVVDKFLSLGAEPRHLAPDQLIYLEFPGRRWDDADKRGLGELLEVNRPALAIFDSAAAFLTLADLDEDRSTDITRFYKGILLDAARTFHAAVVVLDHVTKDGASGRYARGSGAKLQYADVGLMVDPIKPFSRTQSGLLKVAVTKDRPGYLHRGGFEVRVDVEPGAMALTATPTDTHGDPILDALTPAARKVLAVLQAAAKPLAAADIGDRIADRFGHGLKRPTISTALNDLHDRDLATFTADDNGKKSWAAGVSRVSEGVSATPLTGGVTVLGGL
jgi:hypothetical protein